jgi:hypothetical protein
MQQILDLPAHLAPGQLPIIILRQQVVVFRVLVPDVGDDGQPDGGRIELLGSGGSADAAMAGLVRIGCRER